MIVALPSSLLSRIVLLLHHPPRLASASSRAASSSLLPSAWRGAFSMRSSPRPSRRRAAAAAAEGDAPEATEDAPAPAPAPARKKPKKKSKKQMEVSVDTTDAALKAKVQRILDQLQSLFPNPPIPLDHGSNFQLLVAVTLSAQTTDLKVNEVTPALFAKYGDAASLAQAEVSHVTSIIRTLGLAPTKAKNIVAMAQMLMEHHQGQVPDTFEALEALPGVGHKTASVVMSQAWGHPAFPVDTHIHRLAQRWGLTTPSGSVEQTEVDLKALVPQAKWRDAHLQIIFFGRQHCPAQGHDPIACPICAFAAVPPYDKVGASPARPGQKPARSHLQAGSKVRKRLLADDVDSDEEEGGADDGDDDEGTVAVAAAAGRRATSGRRGKRAAS